MTFDEAVKASNQIKKIKEINMSGVSYESIFNACVELYRLTGYRVESVVLSHDNYKLFVDSTGFKKKILPRNVVLSAVGVNIWVTSGDSDYAFISGVGSINLKTTPPQQTECTCTGHTLLHFGCKCKKEKL